MTMQNAWDLALALGLALLAEGLIVGGFVYAVLATGMAL
jgi:hypothetical protein